MPTTPKTVESFLASLDDARRAQAEALRAIIKGAEPKLVEHIKWNAPSYVLDGEDRITFNVMNKERVVQLILHMGATRKENRKGKPVMDDPSGRITWLSDIRGVLVAPDVEEIAAQRAPLKALLRRWLKAT